MSTLPFTPVPVRARRDGWTPGTQAAFIDALARTRNIAAACRAVGRSCQTAYRLRARSDAVAFAAAWDAVLADPERAPTGRAIGGIATPITYRGRQVGERRRYDNRLAKYLLSIRRPGRYGARGRDSVPPVDRAAAVARATLHMDLSTGTACQAGADRGGDVGRKSSPSAPANPHPGTAGARRQRRPTLSIAPEKLGTAPYAVENRPPGGRDAGQDRQLRTAADPPCPRPAPPSARATSSAQSSPAGDPRCAVR